MLCNNSVHCMHCRNRDCCVAQVFTTMEQAQRQSSLQILDWGVANATLEEVFIKFARSIGAESGA